MDPLAESYSFQSPFAYAANNPIYYVDYLGMGPKDWWKSIKSWVSETFGGGNGNQNNGNSNSTSQGTDPALPGGTLPEVVVEADRIIQGNRNNTRPMGPWEILVMELGFDQGVISDFLMSLPMHHLKDYLPADSPKNLFEKHNPHDNWVENFKRLFQRNRRKSPDQIAKESTGDRSDAFGRTIKEFPFDSIAYPVVRHPGMDTTYFKSAIKEYNNIDKELPISNEEYQNIGGKTWRAVKFF